LSSESLAPVNPYALDGDVVGRGSDARVTNAKCCRGANDVLLGKQSTLDGSSPLPSPSVSLPPVNPWDRRGKGQAGSAGAANTKPTPKVEWQLTAVIVVGCAAAG
jgi:hypothetical protein